MDLEDRLRNAFESAASEVTEESLSSGLPPSVDLLPITSDSLEHGRRRWLWPAAAAAAVAATALAASLINSGPDASPGPSAGQPSTKVRQVTPPVHSLSDTSPAHTAIPVETGRRYDVGRIVGPHTLASANPVVLLQRTHIDRRSDGQIARHGFKPYPHTDAIEQGVGATYAIPVRSDATFVVNVCTGFSGGLPLSLAAHHVSAVTFLHSLPVRYGVIVVKLDPHGRLISAQTDGAC